MLICHVSDTHGTFPKLPDVFDVLVHSGDCLPNASRGRVYIEAPFQTQWVEQHVEDYRTWLGGRPMIFIRGNHDFIPSISRILREAGIDATEITSAHHTFAGLKFYGFPYIPYLAGEWNFERRLPEMAIEIQKLRDEIADGVDVLVTHAPPLGIFDSNMVIRSEGKVIPDYGERCGNSLLNTLLNYELTNLPKALLFGHIHESGSQIMTVESWNNMIVSNAATSVNLIEL